MSRFMVFVLCLGLLPSAATAAAYLTSLNFGQDERAINHPVLYFGTGGERQIRVCIDPDLPEIDIREPSVLRAIATWNAMTPFSNNITTDVPSGLVDFETTMLHEMGHCFFGLAHANLALTSDLVAGYATIADTGTNGGFDVGLGSDMQPGSSDDPRGDDVNRFRFRIFDNYPYLLTSVVDQTTYSRDLDDLPPGHLFAANPNRLSGTVAVPPVTNTEAVMNGYIFTGEARRKLQHDDVVGFLYGASGLDETEATADDYTINIVYQGRTTTDCDVLIEELPSEAPLVAAQCEVAAIGIPNADPHFRLAGQAQVQISNDIDWYYPEVFADGFEDGTTDAWADITP